MDNEHHKYIPGGGPLGSKFMILGECPTMKDTDAGRITEEKELTQVLREAGINRADCWLSNVSKYYVPPNGRGRKIPFAVRAKNYGIDVAQQLSELQEEINQIKPNCIFALGSTALWALSGKTDIGFYRGSILHGMGSKFVASFNPAQLSWQSESGAEFKGYWNRQVMIFDAKRAKNQATFPELKLPSRNIEICRNSAQLREFWLRYKSTHRRMAVDIEAGGSCVPICMGLAFTKHHAMVVPLWNEDKISTIPTADLIQCWIILAQMLEEQDILGANFNYDKDKILRIGFRVRKVIGDLMMKAHAINPELSKGLAFNISIYTEEPAYKDDGMYHGTIEDLLKGCGRDACCTIEVDDAMDPDLDELGMRPFYENFLMQLPELYLDIQNQGFRMNHFERDALLRKYIAWDEACRFELFHLTGAEINCNSPKQISSLLWDNLKLPRRDGTGEEEITALLNSQSAVKKKEDRRILELILENRRVRKSISTYLMAMPDYDGRMKTTYFPCLETGRTSTGQQDPPIRPTVEVIDEHGKKKDKVLGIAFQTMTKHGDIGADIRAMYVPDEWHFELGPYGELRVVHEEEVFVQADSAQAEARVIFKLADDNEALRDIDQRDYHALTASWFFGGDELTYSKKALGYEHPIRFVGKTLRHAGHLGAGKRRAAVSVNTDARKFKIPVTITEADAERALKIFHTKQPRIQQVFQAQVVDTLKRCRQLIAPLPYGLNAPLGGKRTFFERWGEELFRQAFSYIPQRAVSDNTKMAAIRIREQIPNIKIVMESHDALLFSIPKSKLSSQIPIIKSEMERPIDFSHCSLPRSELVIPCEVEVGSNYKDLSKFKDALIIMPPTKALELKPRSITEDFAIIDLPADSRLTDIIYRQQERKFEL